MWENISRKVSETSDVGAVGFCGRTIKEVKEKFNGLKKKYKRTQDQRNQTGHGAVTPNPNDHLIEMIIGKESEVIHGIGQKDDCEIFLLKAAEPSLPTFASTAVCQDTAKATDPTPADGVNIILTNVSHSEDT
ncbi:hypothetical protein ACOMHN_043024 [Nucella lapillus]